MNGACSIFESDIGVDDEVGSRGSVIFQVWADGAKLYDSDSMIGGADRQSISIDISGKNEMRLVVGAGPDDINYDHADWVNARVTCGVANDTSGMLPKSPAGVGIKGIRTEECNRETKRLAWRFDNNTGDDRLIATNSK